MRNILFGVSLLSYHFFFLQAQFYFNWQQVSPDNLGGATQAILIDANNPNKVFAGCTTGGLWLSENGGENWSKVTGIDNPFISCITQASNGDIYVGTGGEYLKGANDLRVHTGNGVYKSTDGGINFDLLPETIPDYATEPWSYINNIAIQPDNPDIVYAAFEQGFRMSTDGGATWFSPTGLPASSTWGSSQVHIGSNGVVFVHMNGRLYRSLDGETFSKISGEALPFFPEYSTISLAIAPSNPDYLYAVVHHDVFFYSFAKLLQSTDGGETWAEVAQASDFEFFAALFNHNTIPHVPLALTVHPSNPEQIYMTGNFNWTWTVSTGWMFLDELTFTDTGHNMRTNWKYTVTIDPSNPDNIFVGTDAGIYKSSDGGSSFEPKNQGYHTAQIYGATLWNDSTIVAATHAQGFITLDYQNPVPQAQFYHYGATTDVMTTHLNPNLFIGHTAAGGTVRTADLGENFTSIYDKNIDCYPSTPDSSPSNCQGDGLIDGGSDYRLAHASVNLGDTLIRYVVGSAMGTIWMCETPLSLITAPQWCEIASFASSQYAITSLALSADGDRLLAGTRGQLISIWGLNDTTFCDGEYFNRVIDLDVGNRPVTAVTIHAEYPYIAAIAIGGLNLPNYIYRTDNFLSSNPVFEPIQNNLPPMPVHDLIYEKQSGSFGWVWGSLGTLLAATERGIYYSIDNGDTWLNDFSELEGVPVSDLKQIPHPSGDPFHWFLVASTFGQGVWINDFNTANFYTAIEAPESPAVFDVTISPNPVQASIHLQFSTPRTSPVFIEIFGINGRKWIAQTHLPSDGDHLDISSLPAGQYFLKMQDGKQQTIKKVVVSR